jgi:hypothetical protein
MRLTVRYRETGLGKRYLVNFVPPSRLARSVDPFDLSRHWRNGLPMSRDGQALALYTELI